MKARCGAPGELTACRAEVTCLKRAVSSTLRTTCSQSPISIAPTSQLWAKKDTFDDAARQLTDENRRMCLQKRRTSAVHRLIQIKQRTKNIAIGWCSYNSKDLSPKNVPKKKASKRLHMVKSSSRPTVSRAPKSRLALLNPLLCDDPVLWRKLRNADTRNIVGLQTWTA